MPKIQPALTQSTPKTPTIPLNNIARNPAVMETIVVLLVFGLNCIGNVFATNWVDHLASKVETFNLLPIPWFVQTLMVGFLTPLLFFASNKKLREHAANEVFKANPSKEDSDILPVIKVTNADQDFGQLDFECTKTEEFAEDIGKEYYKTVIKHKDCKDCLAMPSTSSQTLLLCAKHQQTEKSKVRNMDTKITFDDYIREHIDNFSGSSE